MDNTNEMSQGEHPYYSMVVPVYHSANILPKLHARLSAVFENLGRPYELIFVDDSGANVSSWDVIKHLAAKDIHLRGIQLMRNSGQGAATLCGLSHAQGEIIATMDDDLQHPPEELPILLSELEADEYTDIIMGVPKKKQHSFIRRLGSSFINRINSILLDKNPDVQYTSFRVFRRAVLRGLLSQRTQYPAIGPMLFTVTRRIKNVVVDHDERDSGASGYTFGRLLRQTMSNFVGYSMLPLRLLALAGLFGIVGCFLLALYFFSRYFFYGIGVPGWTTTVLLITLISGFNFLAFSILGEFILRILHAANGMPQYVARQIIPKQPSRDGHDEAFVTDGHPDAAQARSHTTHRR